MWIMQSLSDGQKIIYIDFAFTVSMWTDHYFVSCPEGSNAARCVEYMEQKHWLAWKSLFTSASRVSASLRAMNMDVWFMMLYA